MYFELYQILSDFIYGAGTELTGYMDMTLTVMSTIGVLVVFAVPFAVVWCCIKFIFGLCGR
jgi:hypothetical protein